MDAPRLLPLRLSVDISTIVHAFLREIEVVSFRIMGAEGGEGAVGRPPEYSDIRIFFLDACDCFFDVVDIDAEVMQPRDITGFSTDHRYTDITVADTDCVIRPNRFVLFGRAGLGAFHAEHGLVKPGLPHEVFTDNGSMLNPGEHKVASFVGLVQNVPIVPAVPNVKRISGIKMSEAA